MTRRLGLVAPSPKRILGTLAGLWCLAVQPLNAVPAPIDPAVRVSTPAPLRGYHNGCAGEGAAAASSDGGMLAGLCPDGAVGVTDVATGRVIARAKVSPIEQMLFTDDGRELLISTADYDKPGSLFALDLHSGTLRDLHLVTPPQSRVTLSPRGDRFVVSGEDAEYLSDGPRKYASRLYTRDGAPVAAVAGSDPASLVLVFTADGRFIVSVTAPARPADGPVLVMQDAEDGREWWRMPLDPDPNARDPRGDYIVSVHAAGGSKMVYAYQHLGAVDVAARRQTATRADRAYKEYGFEPDGDRLMLIGNNSEAPIDPVTLKLLGSPRRGDETYESLRSWGTLRVVHKGSAFRFRRGPGPELGCYAASPLYCDLARALDTEAESADTSAKARAARQALLLAAVVPIQAAGLPLDDQHKPDDVRASYAEALLTQGDAAAAERQALPLIESTRPDIAGRGAITAAQSLMDRGRYAQAGALAKRALALLATLDAGDKVSGGATRRVALVRLEARSELFQNRPDAALDLVHTGRQEAAVLILGYVNEALSDLSDIEARALEAKGRWADAETIRASALDSADIGDAETTAAAYTGVAGDERHWGRSGQQLRLLERARDTLAAERGPESAATIAAQTRLGRARLLDAGDPSAALADLRIAAGALVHASSRGGDTAEASRIDRATNQSLFGSIVAADWASAAGVGPAALPRRPVAVPTMLGGHENMVTGLAFSPDAKRLYSVSLDGRLVVWDVPSRRPVNGFLLGESSGLWSIAATPDGQQIFIVSRSGKLYGLRTSDLAITQMHTGAAGPVLVSADGKRLVASTNTGVTVRALPSFDTIAELASTANVRTFAINADASLVATLSGGDDPPMTPGQNFNTGVLLTLGNEQTARTTFCIWLAARDKPPSCKPSPFLSVAFRPVGVGDLIGGSTVGLADLLHDKLIARHGATDALLPLPGNKRALLAVEPALPVLIDLDTGRDIVSLIGHQRRISAAVASPDGSLIATGSADSSIRLWNPDGAALGVLGDDRSLFAHVSSLRWASFTADGRRAVSLSTDGELRLWDADTGDLIDNGGFPGLNGLWPELLTGVAAQREMFSPSEDHSALFDGKHRLRAEIARDGLKIYDAKANVIGTVPVAAIQAIAWSADGRQIAVSDGTDVSVWDWRQSKRTAILAASGDRKALAFAPDGRSLYGVGPDVARWSIGTGQRMASRTLAANVVAIDAPGKRIAVGGASGARMLNAATLADIAAEPGPVSTLRFAIDGRLGIGFDDGKAAVVPASGAGRTLRFAAAADTITAIDFSPDGTRAITASRDMNAAIWNLTDGRPIALLGGSRRMN